METLPNAVDEIYNDPTYLVDLLKMMISFWEKLVVLDAATLALSFTATGFFKGQLFGDGGVGYLAAAWKSLFLGITFGLLAQWIAIQSAAVIVPLFKSMRVLSLLEGTPLTSHMSLITSEIVAKAPRLQLTIRATGIATGITGFLGLASSIVAFWWLYRFAHVNVVMLRH